MCMPTLSGQSGNDDKCPLLSLAQPTPRKVNLLHLVQPPQSCYARGKVHKTGKCQRELYLDKEYRAVVDLSTSSQATAGQ